MMRRRDFNRSSAAAALAGIVCPGRARAQAWPAKPVTLVVPFAAGGGTDSIARPWAHALSRAFAEEFLVENRGGASGLFGAEAVAKAKPDGYTFLVASNTAPVNLPLLRKVPYDPERLVPVARLGDTMTGFAVNPTSGLDSLSALIQRAREHPNMLAFGSSGAGTLPHLRMEMLAYRTGIQLLHLPYRGGADALQDLLASNIHVMNEPSCNAPAKAGSIRLLCMNHSARHPDFPDVPTLTELGYADADVPLWFSIWAPAGVPEDIIATLHAKVTAISRTPEMIASLRAVGAAAVVQSRKELTEFREAQKAATAELIEKAKIKLE